MKLSELETAVETVLQDMDLRAKIGVTKFDALNIRRRKSVPKMLELLFKAGKLQLKNE